MDKIAVKRTDIFATRSFTKTQFVSKYDLPANFAFLAPTTEPKKSALAAMPPTQTASVADISPTPSATTADTANKTPLETKPPANISEPAPTTEELKTLIAAAPAVKSWFDE